MNINLLLNAFWNALNKTYCIGTNKNNTKKMHKKKNITALQSPGMVITQMYKNFRL